MASVRASQPVLALDIGGVCLQLRPEAVCRRLGVAPTANLRERFPELWELAAQLETGRIGEDEFLAVASVRLGLPPAKVREAWLEMIGDEIPGVGDFVDQALALGCRAVFLSDVSALHYGALLPRLSFSERMHGAVLSYEVGALKPDARMFRAFEERHCAGGVPTLYVDDRANNVDAARQRGWPTYQFGNFAGALAALEDQLQAGGS